jgi:hypothetical protein
MMFPKGNLREHHYLLGELTKSHFVFVDFLSFNSDFLLDTEVLLLLFHFLERAALFFLGHGGLGGSDG